MIRVLTTVSLVKLQPQTLFAVQVAERVWAKYGADVLWLTSGDDGAHKAGSRHYDGLAVDLRVKNLPANVWDTATAELAAALGPQYDVLLEHDPPHVHVEFDPTHLNK